MDEKTTARRTSDDAGLGLVEIVIAMMLMLILAVAFLPILVQGLKATAVNATRATAAQLAHAQVERARAANADCSDVQALANTPVDPVVDPRNVTLAIVSVAGACPASYPGTVSYVVTITRTDTNEQLAVANTLVLVENG
jgi:type II secretory pathway pseudopilin PulG